MVIHVNATAPLDHRWERSASIPPPEAVLEAATSIPLLNTNRDTLRELNLLAEAWRAQGLDVSLIEVNLNQLPDSARRSRLLALPTVLTLPAADVDDLRKAARDLLEAHSEFLRLTRAP
ncbi:MAG: hypothetical protein ACP5RC_04745 [Halothiobacillaceae bacterium]